VAAQNGVEGIGIPSHCFHQSTPISISAEKAVAISKIVVGDAILTFDPSKQTASTLCFGSVKRLFQNVTDEWIELMVPGQPPVFVTPGHRYLLPGGGFAEIGTMIADAEALSRPHYRFRSRLQKSIRNW